MNIRKAESKDIDKILDLLSQVLEVHAKIRPDIFVSGSIESSLISVLFKEANHLNFKEGFFAESNFSCFWFGELSRSVLFKDASSKAHDLKIIL